MSNKIGFCLKKNGGEICLYYVNKYDGYTLDLDTFSTALNLNLEELKNILKSYNGKLNCTFNYSFITEYCYFENIKDGLLLIDQLNILFNLVGDKI